MASNVLLMSARWRQDPFVIGHVLDVIDFLGLRKSLPVYIMSLVNLNLNTDRTVNKIAFCSAVVAGFAYVGYSVCRSAFSRSRRGRREEDDSPRRTVFLRRLSQTTQTDALLGELIQDGSQRFVIRPKSVQERIRELNMQARQFANTVTAIQNNGHRINGVSGRSLQVTPWGSPRLLSPVDVRHIVPEYGEADQRFSPLASPSRQRWSRNNSFKINRRQVEFEVHGDAKLKEVEQLWDDNKLEIIQSLPHLLSCQSREISLEEAKQIVAALNSDDDTLVQGILAAVANYAAFTNNQNNLRQAGVLVILPKLITTNSSRQIRLKACPVVANMALNETNHSEMRTVTLALAHLVQTSVDPSLLTSALAALVNVAVLSTWHKEMKSLLHKTYSFLDDGHWTGYSFQSLRLLVNLSCNGEMIPSLLAAQAPAKLIYLLDMSMPENVILRVATLLANIATARKKMNIDPLDLPAEDKAAAPDTMYAAVFGLSMVERYKKKALMLSERYENEDVVMQARRLRAALCD